MRTHYVHLPLVYDQWQKSYGRDFSTAILPRLLSTMRKFKIRKSAMLDLACGTGTLAVKMAKRGWKVWGVDASEGMLEEAQKKIQGTKLSVKFLLQDMRSFALPERVALVTCLFDSLNHLTRKRDLEATFRCVYENLHDDGYFMFDLNNGHCFRNVWTMTDTFEMGGCTLTLNNTFDPGLDIGRSQISIFAGTAGGLPQHVEEVKERHYPREIVRAMLAKAGFQILCVEDFNFTRRPEIGNIKTWWVARKTP